MAADLAFDPGAGVDDLLDPGWGVTLVRGAPVGPPHVCIIPPGGRWSASACCAVMEMWADALDPYPDHGERILVHLAAQATGTP